MIASDIAPATTIVIMLGNSAIIMVIMPSGVGSTAHKVVCIMSAPTSYIVLSASGWIYRFPESPIPLN